MPFQIVYASRANQPMAAETLEKILVDARKGNAERGITGALLYTEQVFFQILEGDEKQVRQLMQSINDDSRHSAVKVIYETEVESPAFASWSMAYHTPSLEELKKWTGLPGSVTIEELIDKIHQHPQNVPQFLINILETLGEDYTDKGD